MRDWWIWEWLIFVVAGAGLIATGLILWRRGHPDRPPGGLEAGALRPGAEINISRLVLGGDIGGLLVVIGIIVAILPMLWGWFLAVAIGAGVCAVALFLWHRYHPW
jgi:hypothetical protein